MKCSRILGVSLVILAGWALGAGSSEPGWTRERSLAHRGRLRQLLSGGDRCWLGAEVRRPRAAPQHHLFGVYPNRPSSYLGPSPLGDLATRPAGRREPATEGAAGAGASSEAEQPAAPWAGDGPIGQSALLGDDDTSPDDGGSKPSLGEAGTRHRSATAATVTTPFAHRKEPKAGTRGKGRAKTRRRRQVVKGQAEGVQGDPDASPRHFQPLPGVRTSALEDSVQKGAGDPSREAEPSQPRGGRLPVLYFSGRRERLRLRPEALAEIPREAFTVEAWVRPEGGQSNPAIITGNGPRRALRGPGRYEASPVLDETQGTRVGGWSSRAAPAWWGRGFLRWPGRFQTLTREHGPLSCCPLPGTVLALGRPPAHSRPSRGGDLCFVVTGEELSYLSSRGPI